MYLLLPINVTHTPLLLPEVAVGNFTEEVAPPFGASTLDPLRAGIKPRGPQILEVDFMPETGGVPGE